MELRFQVQAKIKKPVGEVFDAIYNPKKLSVYFARARATGPLDEGTTVMWEFSEFPGAYPVYVREVSKDKRILFEWENTKTSKKLRVEMTFERLDENSTLLKISESGWKENEEALDESYHHCAGWMQMLCCLKVYVEDGKNLREFFI
jgi:uncharacterized protein YndB with AHSA1/START domain